MAGISGLAAMIEAGTPVEDGSPVLNSSPRNRSRSPSGDSTIPTRWRPYWSVAGPSPTRSPLMSRLMFGIALPPSDSATALSPPPRYQRPNAGSQLLGATHRDAVVQGARTGTDPVDAVSGKRFW